MGAVYHLRLKNGIPACGSFRPGEDVVISDEEARDPKGRWYNCPDCHATLTGGKRHVSAPEDSDVD